MRGLKFSVLAALGALSGESSRSLERFPDEGSFFGEHFVLGQMRNFSVGVVVAAGGGEDCRVDHDSRRSEFFLGHVEPSVKTERAVGLIFLEQNQTEDSAMGKTRRFLFDKLARDRF